MKNLAWKDDYLIGYSSVDKEHKKLFEIAHRAFSAVVGNEKISKIKTIVSELINYTKVHFANEEKYMFSVKYPSLSEHKEQHKKILSSMNEFLKTINQKDINDLEKELAYFIEQWFINHIIFEDKKISQYARKLADKPFLEWNTSFSIGASAIDKEHKELFAIANTAFTCKDFKEKSKNLKQSIIQLYKYIQTHFSNEEKLMEAIKFDELEEHLKEHERIQESLNQILKSSASCELEVLEEKLKDFIKIGLIDHIKKEDIKIGNWIRYNSEKPEIKQL